MRLYFCLPLRFCMARYYHPIPEFSGRCRMFRNIGRIYCIRSQSKLCPIRHFLLLQSGYYPKSSIPKVPLKNCFRSDDPNPKLPLNSQLSEKCTGEIRPAEWKSVRLLHFHLSAKQNSIPEKQFRWNDQSANGNLHPDFQEIREPSAVCLRWLAST